MQGNKFFMLFKSQSKAGIIVCINVNLDKESPGYLLSARPRPGTGAGVAQVAGQDNIAQCRG